MSKSEYVERETCEAKMKGTEALAMAAKDIATAKYQVLEEKIKSIKAQITIGFTVSSLVIVSVQFALRFL